MRAWPVGLRRRRRAQGSGQCGRGRDSCAIPVVRSRRRGCAPSERDRCCDEHASAGERGRAEAYRARPRAREITVQCCLSWFALASWTMRGDVGWKMCGPVRLWLGCYRSRGCWSGLLLDPRVDLIGLHGLCNRGRRLSRREVIEEFVGLRPLGRRRRRVSRSRCDSIDQSDTFEPLGVGGRDLFRTGGVFVLVVDASSLDEIDGDGSSVVGAPVFTSNPHRVKVP